MNHIILTESDLATIDNALLEAAYKCRWDAERFPALRAESLEAAEQYDLLQEKLAEADTIIVKRSP